MEDENYPGLVILEKWRRTKLNKEEPSGQEVMESKVVMLEAGPSSQTELQDEQQHAHSTTHIHTTPSFTPTFRRTHLPDECKRPYARGNELGTRMRTVGKKNAGFLSLKNWWRAKFSQQEPSGQKVVELQEVVLADGPSSSTKLQDEQQYPHASTHKNPRASSTPTVRQNKFLDVCKSPSRENEPNQNDILSTDIISKGSRSSTENLGGSASHSEAHIAHIGPCETTGLEQRSRSLSPQSARQQQGHPASGFGKGKLDPYLTHNTVPLNFAHVVTSRHSDTTSLDQQPQFPSPRSTRHQHGYPVSAVGRQQGCHRPPDLSKLSTPQLKPSTTICPKRESSCTDNPVPPYFAQKVTSGPCDTTDVDDSDLIAAVRRRQGRRQLPSTPNKLSTLHLLPSFFNFPKVDRSPTETAAPPYFEDAVEFGRVKRILLSTPPNSN